MKCYLKVYGNNYSIILEPEDKADKKLLDFVGEHDGGTLTVNRSNDRHRSYSSDDPKYIENVEIDLHKRQKTVGDVIKEDGLPC